MGDDELEAIRAELDKPAPYGLLRRSISDNLLRYVDELRAELATATTAYELVRSDCHNLTEKVIPNLRAELAALKEAKEADFEAYHEIYMVLLNSRRDRTLITGLELAKALVAERGALREAAGKVTCRTCDNTGIDQGWLPKQVPCGYCAALRKILGEKHE
jgi:hypothetical protein